MTEGISCKIIFAFFLDLRYEIDYIPKLIYFFLLLAIADVAQKMDFDDSS